MQSTQDINILVSGAGIAGLTVAYWLIQYGFTVTLTERAPYLRKGGQALDLRGPALEVAQKMGILDTIKSNSTKLTGMSVIDAATGSEIYRNTEQTLTSGRLDSPDVEILRDELCRILYESINGKARFLFDNAITAIEQDLTGARITFTRTAPERFDLVIGADGLRSNVRKLVFGSDETFVKYLGYYVAVFTMPNFLGLDHWEVGYQHEGTPVATCIGKEKDHDIRAYLGFAAPQPLVYNHQDLTAQKKLVATHTPEVGKVLPQMVRYMQDTDQFYFDSVNQVIMPCWSKGRVTLLGDAGYSVSLSLGQGTTVAMTGAYVLAGELALHAGRIPAALNSYETLLRDYVASNQALAFDAQSGPEPTGDITDGPRDLGQSVIPFSLKTYTDLL